MERFLAACRHFSEERSWVSHFLGTETVPAGSHLMSYMELSFVRWARSSNILPGRNRGLRPSIEASRTSVPYALERHWS